LAAHITKKLAETDAEVELTYDKKQAQRFCFQPTVSKATLLLIMNDFSLLPVLGFSKRQMNTECQLPFTRRSRLLADAEATIDADYPVQSQLIRSDKGYVKLMADFNTRFGRRKDRRRAKNRVGKLMRHAEREGKADTPGGVQLEDGHLLTCEYLWSLAYCALIRVHPRWHEPGMDLLQSVRIDESDDSLKQRTLAALLSLAPPVDKAEVESASLNAAFQHLLRILATGRPKQRFGSGSKTTLESYNLSSILCDFVHGTKLQDARKEIQLALVDAAGVGGNESVEIPDDEALLHILKAKLKGERDAAVTTDDESWFTETDRSVRTLLDRQRYRGSEKGGGAGCLWGQMIILRVYENQENMSMQTIFRDALPKLKLVRKEEHTTLETARAFSVLSDIGSTAISDAIEPYFFDPHDLRRWTGSELLGLDTKGRVRELSDDDPRVTLRQILERKKESYQLDVARGRRKSKAELNYEDLHNLPMLLIVTEKARMGDTFPQSFAVFDLRMRTAGSLVPFVQELGRMCRYPTTYPLFLQMGLTEGRLQVQLAAEIEVISNDAVVQNAFRKELRLMVVKENGSDSDIIGHAASSDQLRELLEALRKLGDPEARFELHCYFDRRLPRATIRDDIQTKLVEGINRKCRLAPKSAHVSALDCVVMKSGIDDYMQHACAPKTLACGISGNSNPLHTYHRYTPTSCQADQNGQDYNGSGRHYDTRQRGKHERRLLLFAECQIGKTGAYLRYIVRLRESIRNSRLLAFIRPDVVDVTWSWHFPCWKHLQRSDLLKLNYEQPKGGHYYEKIAKARLGKLQTLAWDESPDWAQTYCNWLLSEDGELIISKAGRDRVEKLQVRLKGKALPLKKEGHLKDGPEAADTFKACINWDSRMGGLLHLDSKLDELRVQGYNAAADFWEMRADPVGYSSAAEQGDSSAAHMMMARREPTYPREVSVAHRGRLTKHSLIIPKKIHGGAEHCGAALLEDVACQLYVPESMSDRLTSDLTASRAKTSAASIYHR
jgi:hypothetical protein